MFDIEVLWAMILDYKETWGFKEHSHKDYYQLFYIQNLVGNEYMFINGDEIPLYNGQIILIKPGTLHELKPIYNTELRLIDIKFSVKNPLVLNMLDKIDISFPEYGNNINSQLQHVREYWLMRDSYGERMSSLILQQVLMGYLIQNRSNKTKKQIIITDIEKKLQAVGSNVSPVVDHIIQYIRNNYTNPITLDELSELTAYSKSSLCRIFKRETRMTIISYVNKIRVAKSINLLKNTTLTINEISFLVGFSNPPYFSKQFKKIIGVSPIIIRDVDMQKVIEDIHYHGSFDYRYNTK